MPDQPLPAAPTDPAPPEGAGAEAPPPGAPSPGAKDLAALRAEIDGIDDALHDLLMRRADLVAHMAGSRAKQDGPIFRPGREAAILRRLFGRNRGALPRAVVLRLWREVIGASLAQQGAFSIAVQPSPDGAVTRLARGHFGLLAPARVLPTAARALTAVGQGEASVAVLAAPQEGEPAEAAWWMQVETPRLQVVAALPFLAAAGAAAQAYAVAALAPEPTGRDRSLLRIEPGPEQSRARIQAALAAAGLKAHWLLRRDTPAPMALAEIDGFLAPGDARLAALPFPHTQILGAYAEPEPEE